MGIGKWGSMVTDGPTIVSLLNHKTHFKGQMSTIISITQDNDFAERLIGWARQIAAKSFLQELTDEAFAELDSIANANLTQEALDNAGQKVLNQAATFWY